MEDDELFIAQHNTSDYQNQLLSLIRRGALDFGLAVSFEGLFWQGRLEKSGVYQDPFVIAQTREEQALLVKGQLSGRIIEELGVAQINGQLSQEKIDFIKRYELRFAYLNRSEIFYKGRSTDVGERYSGQWSFDKTKTVDMATEGKFELVRVLPR